MPTHTVSAATALRAAVTRVSRAASAVLVSAAPEQLPLGEFLVDELRAAALRVLALLEPDHVEHVTALAMDEQQRIARAVAALAALDLRELSRESRAELAVSVSAVYADLRHAGDEDVTRALLDSTPAGSDLASLVFTVDPRALGPDAQVSFCQAAQRLESAAHARLSAGLIAFAGNNPRQTQYWVDGDEQVITDVRASELALALSWSGNKARSALEAARVLHADLDAVAEAAAAGTLQPATVTAIADGAQLLTASFDVAIEEARQALQSDVDSAGEIADRLWELTSARDEVMQRYDAAVSDFAVEHTLAETKRKVRDTLAKLDPEGFETRRAKAQQLQSGVELRALPDAMSMITAVMPSEHATACYRALDAHAHDASRTDFSLPVGVRRSNALLAFCATGGSTTGTLGASTRAGQHHATSAGERASAVDAPSGAAHAGDGFVCVSSAMGSSTGHAGMDDRDADACCDSACNAGASTPTGSASGTDTANKVGAGAARAGLGAHVDLVMTLDAFLGLSETPAECVGAGPIPASAAREFLADASLVTFRRVLVDSNTGHALDVGVKRYQLTPSEREYILARDRVCRRPGCNMPAHRCETDHAIPYDAGGPSSSDNLGALCVRHHQEKTHGGWTIEDSAADGSCAFISPLGRRYEHEAEPVLPWAILNPSGELVPTEED